MKAKGIFFFFNDSTIFENYDCFQDGCWGCFDDVHNLSQDGVAVLLDHAQSIFSALKNRAGYCYVGDGHQVNNNNISCLIVSLLIYHSNLSIQQNSVVEDVYCIWSDFGLIQDVPN